MENATGKSLSIVIPAYDEELRLPSTLRDVKEYLRTVGAKWEKAEVIVVADGCSDGTEKLVSETRSEFPELKLVAYPENKGKGHALKVGVAETTGDIVTFADADGATPIGELDHLADPILANSADMIIASRRTPDAKLAVSQPFHRRLLGNAFSLAVRIILGVPFLDTQCGFKVFRGSVARELFAASECAGFAIDIELIHTALKRGYLVEERGVEWHDVPESKVNPLRDGVKMLAFAIALSLSSRFSSAPHRPRLP
ncbi:MAG: glycosyltransferase family 2 protein [Kiritimatiellaeota bacterium]|nr:glycosyltransferase family 2 protein [Kiritimatiellota bacterium]